MRIKEVEETVQVTRKNIRFYEKEGLLSPKRDSENGYREYSDEDIMELKKVRLFRKLGIPIEDIRLLQSGVIFLKEVLEKRISRFANEIDNLDEAKDFCIKIKSQNISFEGIDADLWLSRMSEKEEKGVKFMSTNNDEIIRFLPDKFKMQYYESIIRNGQVDSDLLKQIISYLEDTYKKKVDTEEFLVDILKKVSSDEKSELLLMIKKNNPELFSKISDNIFDFEDIITLDPETVKKILEQFSPQIIVKASMGASPRVNEYLKGLFPDIDFIEERNTIGSIPINEIMNIHDEIIEAVNNR